MKLLNTTTSYGLLAVFLHWVMAIIIIALFFLGDYMVGLGYYDQLYHQAPWWHKSIGISLFLLLLTRIMVKLSSTSPKPLATYKSWEISLAKITHLSFYFLLLIICASGYLIATAKGVGIEVFSGFKIPAIMTLTESQTDLSGDIHRVSSTILIALLILHIAASIKHHFIDRDATLTRMLGKTNP